jgi:hypothetical protein
MVERSTIRTAADRKGSGGSSSVDIIDQLQADSDPEYRKNFLNRKLGFE